MRKFAFLLSFVLVASSASVWAAGPGKDGNSSAKVVNKKCPISGKPINGMTFVTYKGKKVGFCCPGCPPEFLKWDDKKKDAFIEHAMSADTPEPMAKTATWDGDPYTLATCQVTGEELGKMGPAPSKEIDGREVRVCCSHCFGTIEKDKKKYFDKVDAAMAKDQRPYYPLTTCVVSHEPLTYHGRDKAIEFVYKNRLFRLCCHDCEKAIRKDPAKYVAALDAAVKKAQAKTYGLETCPVSGEKVGHEGDPYEIVVANRLIRFCCKDCLKKFNEEPAKYIAKVDAARKKDKK